MWPTLFLCAAAAVAPAAPDVPSFTPPLPDPLVMTDGSAVTSPEQWREKRRPELLKLFEEQMYGVAPDAPQITATVSGVDEHFFGGAATKKEVAIQFGPPPGVTLHLLLIVPNNHKPAPVFLGLNFHGNHAITDDPSVALPTNWMPEKGPGVKDHRATEAGRGAETRNWSAKQTIDRGYALATFYVGDVKADKPDFADGVHALYFKPGQTSPGEKEWGVIRAWAWGASRAVDYLVTDKDIDAKRIAIVGHSRNGKASIVAAAYDPRIALVIPHQAGCGGTSPSRGTIGETPKIINTHFPHWFSGTFKAYNEDPSKLTFDQHELIALIAPRPILLSCATDDQWSNPAGQFEMLKAAEPVYKLLAHPGNRTVGLASAETPVLNKTIGGEESYFLRPGKHSMAPEDWAAFLDFADQHLIKSAR